VWLSARTARSTRLERLSMLRTTTTAWRVEVAVEDDHDNAVLIGDRLASVREADDAGGGDWPPCEGGRDGSRRS
jgi:hypothetical protein